MVNFNYPDTNKQAIEIPFSKKTWNNYPLLTFDDDNIPIAISQKHLGLVWDSRLGLNERISNKINKLNTIIGNIKNLSLFFLCKTLLTIDYLRS